jgi:hypothetical protein
MKVKYQDMAPLGKIIGFPVAMILVAAIGLLALLAWLTGGNGIEK